MKKLVAASCLAGCLALAAPAISAVQTFGSDATRFTIEVPDGWKATPIDIGCQLESPDRKTAFTVQYKQSGGKSATELAMSIGQELVKNHPEYKLLGAKDVGQNLTFMEFETNNIKVTVGVSVNSDVCCVVTAAGSDMNEVSNILKTIKAAK